MANVPEDGGWIAGIYQWEQDDPVVGGVPDLVNIPGAGLDNVPTSQLASRTVYLRDRLTGIGDTAILTADFNALAVSGFYRGDAGATGHPSAGSEPVTILHVQGDNGKGSQTAWLTDGKTYTRHRAAGGAAWGSWAQSMSVERFQSALPNGNIDDAVETGAYYGFGLGHVSASAGDNPFTGFNGTFVVEVTNPAWGGATEKIIQRATAIREDGQEIYVRVNNTGTWRPWTRILDEAYAPTAVEAMQAQSRAINGWQQFIGGMYLQWGQHTIVADGDQIFFPIAFPGTCYSVTVSDLTAQATAPSGVGSFGVEFDTTTRTQFRLRVASGFSGLIQWNAIGF